jgi:hypothetical protein
MGMIDQGSACPFSRLREKVSREGATDEGPHPIPLRGATLSCKRGRV